MSLPKSIWQGSFRIFGVDIKCHVLDNGTRIIEAESFQKILEALDTAGFLELGEFDDFIKWEKG